MLLSTRRFDQVRSRCHQVFLILAIYDNSCVDYCDILSVSNRLKQHIIIKSCHYSKWQYQMWVKKNQKPKTKTKNKKIQTNKKHDSNSFSLLGLLVLEMEYITLELKEFYSIVRGFISHNCCSISIFKWRFIIQN